MNIAYYFFIVVVLLPRIFAYWKNDDALRLKHILLSLIAETILLSPLFSPKSYAILIPTLLVYHTCQYLLQRNGTSLLPKRILEFIFLVIVSSFIFGIFPENIPFNQPIVKILQIIIGHCALFPEFTAYFLKKTLIYLLGVLLLVNEINNIIRYVLNLMNMEPMSDNKGHSTPDAQELNRGKIIGVVERILFFFFVITGNYASIAFILTAKGITRFKELDNKNFAEYVLIGTLLSSGLAIFCAVLITKMVAAIGRP